MGKGKSDWQLESKLCAISKRGKGKDQEWYKEELQKEGIKFLEITIRNCNLVVPEYVFNRMSQKDKNKLLKV